ncbi:alpha-ketoglutarate-dependent dioxygenase AlkB [Saprospiraceae bacterium]|nr:alpha-ketoglutarate-dependent dioxygenase AlkB [Saprospiraceae bacterium]
MISPIQHIDIPNGKMDYYPLFITATESKEFMRILKAEVSWKQDEIKMFGKIHQVPRLQAWYGDENLAYSYSGIKMEPEKWHPLLAKIKKQIEEKTGFEFNSVLVNLYRDGQDSNGWHADNERELGINPVIASVTLGEERFFHIKHRKIQEQRKKLKLENGSLLVMHGTMQHHWLHQIAKTKREVGVRLNLTFRKIIS